MTRQPPILTFQVDPHDHDRPFLSILRGRYGMSRTLLRRLQRSGTLLADERPVSVRDLAVAGASVAVYIPYDPTPVAPEDLPVPIVYEDRHILVAEKLSGMLVHPTAMEPTGSLTAALVHHLRQAGEIAFVGPVTRLDKGTSGLVLCAKTPYAHYRLSRQMEAGQLERVYIALVHGWVVDDRGTINAPIRRVEGALSRREVGSGGQRAVTHFEVLSRYEGSFRATLVKVQLETGRTHQIRVHFAYVGHPLIGDWMYGEVGARPQESRMLDRPALHASELKLLHPVDGTRLHFTSPLPGDVQDLLAKLER